jgi:hypothetical protein
MMTALILLSLIALVLTVVSALKKCEPWIPLVFVCVVLLLERIPLGK